MGCDYYISVCLVATTDDGSRVEVHLENIRGYYPDHPDDNENDNGDEDDNANATAWQHYRDRHAAAYDQIYKQNGEWQIKNNDTRQRLLDLLRRPHNTTHDDPASLTDQNIVNLRQEGSAWERP